LDHASPGWRVIKKKRTKIVNFWRLVGTVDFGAVGGRMRLRRQLRSPARDRNKRKR